MKWPKQELLPVAVAALCGCASIISGRTQAVSFISNPEGATVTINGKVIGKTPLTTNLQKKTGQRLGFSKDGYKPLSLELETSLNSWFWGNIVLGGLLGSSTDGITGSVHKYSPSQYMITLEPDGSAKIDAKPLLDDQQKAKEYIVVAYRNLKEEFSKNKVGDYSTSLLTILKIPAPERPAALEKIKALALAYQDIPTFADRTMEMFLEGTASQPAAPIEVEVVKADWKAIPADANIKIHSKNGGVLIGNLISFDGDYLWIAFAGSGKKAVLVSEVDRIAVIK